MAKAKPKSKAYKALHTDMMANLSARGLIEIVYADKVDEYMNFWQQAQKLRADIDEHGVTCFDAKRGMYVENRSVSLLVQVSRQMLAIYQALGFRDLALAAEMTDDVDNEL